MVELGLYGLMKKHNITREQLRDILRLRRELKKYRYKYKGD